MYYIPAQHCRKVYLQKNTKNKHCVPPTRSIRTIPTPVSHHTPSRYFHPLRLPKFLEVQSKADLTKPTTSAGNCHFLDPKQ